MLLTLGLLCTYTCVSAARSSESYTYKYIFPSSVNVSNRAYVGLTIVPVNKAIGEQITLHIRNAGVL